MIMITKNGVFVEIQSFFLHSVTKKLNSFGPPEFVLLSFTIRLFNVSSSPTETINCSDKVEPRQGGYHPCWRPQNASPSNRKRRAPISSDYSNTHVDQKKKSPIRFVWVFFLFSADHRSSLNGPKRTKQNGIFLTVQMHPRNPHCMLIAVRIFGRRNRGQTGLKLPTFPRQRDKWPAPLPVRSDNKTTDTHFHHLG
jgi:hypothetical protein